MFLKQYSEIMEHIMLHGKKREEILKTISTTGIEHLGKKASAPSK